jgi:hypothetical protein
MFRRFGTTYCLLQVTHNSEDGGSTLTRNFGKFNHYKLQKPKGRPSCTDDMCPSLRALQRCSSPVTGLDRRWGFQEVEALRSQDIRHMKVAGLSAIRTGRLNPWKYCWYSFQLEDGLSPGPQCVRKDYVNEKFQWNHQESYPRPTGL